MTTWEYMSVTWSMAAELSDGEWTYTLTLTTNGPGSDKPEKREVDQDWVFLDFANALGAEGWELIYTTAPEIAVMHLRGWDRASRPLSHNWMFKRPVTDSQTPHVAP